MKKWYAFVAGLLVVCCLGGCSPTDKSTATPLTEEELAFFNGTEFFNSEQNGNAIILNIRNQFLSSTYDEPKNIDLSELFYNGWSLKNPITNEETLAVMAKLDMGTDIDQLPSPIMKMSIPEMDTVLQEHMGLALTDTAQIGLENFTYLPEYQAYYSLHGDSNYRTQVQFSKGERDGDLLRLFYTDDFFVDGDKVLTLQSKDGGYLFVSNQLLEKAS